MLYKKRLEAVEEELQMVRIFDPQIHIEVWPKLDYASTLFTYMTSLMSLENRSVKVKELTRIVFYKFSILCSVPTPCGSKWIVVT